jgi:hypothetical protein
MKELRRLREMKAVRAAVVFALILGVAGCGGSDKDTAATTVMPDVEGRQLDDAKSDIKRAGFEDDVDVDGGGTFGIVVESNWKVCDQSPAAGKAITATPKLTVDRGCDDDDAAPESSKPPVTTAEPTNNATKPDKPKPPEVLTAANNAEFAALLAGSDCDKAIQRFVSKYRGQTIEFDGNIAHLGFEVDPPRPVSERVEHDPTRHDVLVYAGDEALAGPNFKFRNVIMDDLNLTGSPGSLAVGDKVHLKAKVGDYNDVQCLFFLDPVSTTVR